MLTQKLVEQVEVAFNPECQGRYSVYLLYSTKVQQVLSLLALLGRKDIY